MPHVVVKLWPGKTEKQKTELTEEIVKSVTRVLHYGQESVSVSMVEVRPEDWLEKVYRPDIESKRDLLYKEPGYDASDL